MTSDFYPPHNSISATVKALRELVDHLKVQHGFGSDDPLTTLIQNAQLALNGSTSIEPPQCKVCARWDTPLLNGACTPACEAHD